jgi:hypothetical protein
MGSSLHARKIAGGLQAREAFLVVASLFHEREAERREAFLWISPCGDASLAKDARLPALHRGDFGHSGP